MCANTEEVLIYSGADKDDGLKLEHTLRGHDILVSSIDWSPVHNKIVTCAHDRNAFVWTLTGDEWKPSLSILRINRAALCVRWSPDGKKFAVASGAKVVPVCHYEQQNDWWISKMIKKHKSTVQSVAWHPNSQLLATACSDFRARIFSAYIPEIDGNGVKSIVCGDTSQTSFGDLLAEFAGSNGWVESVAWAPNGLTLAYVGHDSSISFSVWDEKNPTAEPTQETFKSNSLPHTSVLFLGDGICVAAGHDFFPVIYQHPGPNRGTWKFLGSPDKEPPSAAKKKDDKPAPAEATGFSASKSLWANKTIKGQDAATESASADLWTKHTNTIVDMRPYGDTQWSFKVEAFSTAGLDGKVVVWQAKGSVPGLNM